MSTSTVEDVVKAYVAALREGRRPVAAVIEQLHLPKFEALRLISDARKLGLLEDKDDPDLPARLVAHALGVRYEALVEAVTRYADGELTVQPELR